MTVLAVIEPIRVRVPPARPCTADDCGRAAAAHLVWRNDQTQQLLAEEICGWHLFRLQGRKGCLTFPLDRMPSLQVIGQAFMNEQARRVREDMRRYQPYQSTGYAGFGGFNGGNIRFNVTFG